MLTTQMLCPEIDFAYDPVPNLHELMDRLRSFGPVVPVKYHGQRTWLINSFTLLSKAFADEVHFQSAATYLIHGEPSMGLTLQTMAGEQHRINRGLVSRPFFPREVRTLAESLIEPTATELLDRIEGCEEIGFIKVLSTPSPFSSHHPAV